MDEDLLQDFLIEAGELIDGIDGELIALEGAPDDATALNAVFRTFHTIKGGAGFLELEPLVAICHRAEDVLNAIRSGQRRLDANAMDLVLQSVDEVKRMFGEVADGKAPAAAPNALLDALDGLKHASDEAHARVRKVAAEADSAAAVAPAEESTAQLADASAADPVLAEFEQLLAGARGNAHEEPGADDGLITDDEFDALLDAIHDGGTAASPPPEARGDDGGSEERAADEGSEERAVSDARAVPSETSAGAAGAIAAAAQSDAAAGNGAQPRLRAMEQSLRVDAGRVDGIMNLVGELVLVRNRLSALRSRVHDEDVHRALSQLNLVTSDLQDSVLRLRMQPVGKVFGRFPRVVRDLTRRLGKEADLEMHGEGTELDKGMVEGLADPLIHLVRNAIDHGLETPAERERAGKPPRGRLRLAAHQEGSHIFITVADDGAGLDAAAIKQKALDKGLIDARSALQMPDAEALNLIFAPGFSTRSEVSDISGRGVGLDVVKSQISRINGSVEIQSDKGSGTRVVLRLPLTLAILPTLIIGVGAQQLALPLPVVEEIIDFDPMQGALMDGREVLSLRGDVLPLLDLERWVGPAEERRPSDSAGVSSSASVVVANAGTRRVALLVHRLMGQEEVVIKPLGTRLEGLPGFGGATITGDGAIALIVDVGSLVSHWEQLAVHPARAVRRSAAESAG